MCTVTFIGSKDKVVITSNRDEHISRKANLKPYIEVINGIKVLYPKDKTAGGTWFAVNENGAVAVLLNGAFQNHKRMLPYRKSRGQIVLDIISSEDPLSKIMEIDLKEIEQFTLVLYQDSSLFEFRWDGHQKHWKGLNQSEKHLWSSWTLYNKAAQSKRDHYFGEFTSNNALPTTQDIMAFHKENYGDFENGFVIDRKNGLKTLSITQVVLTAENIALDHHDLDEGHMESTFMNPVSPLLVQQ